MSKMSKEKIGKLAFFIIILIPHIYYVIYGITALINVEDIRSCETIRSNSFVAVIYAIMISFYFIYLFYLTLLDRDQPDKNLSIQGVLFLLALTCIVFGVAILGFCLKFFGSNHYPLECAGLVPELWHLDII